MTVITEYRYNAIHMYLYLIERHSLTYVDKESADQ